MPMSTESAFLGRLYRLVPDLREVTLRVHCHDPQAGGFASSPASWQASQVEGAINEDKRAGRQPALEGDS